MMINRAAYLREWRKRENPNSTIRGTKGWRRAISNATKKAMRAENIQEKLHKKRKPMTLSNRILRSRLLEGKYPKNFEDMTKRSPFGTSKGWIEIGNKRFFAKSMWERNYARYLEFLKTKKQIQDWEYEPQLFIFEKIKFGNRTYRPDFKVIEMDGTYVWHEVKGWMTPASRTKLRRMSKYFPYETIFLIEKEEYQAIKKSIMPFIKDWESTRYA